MEIRATRPSQCYRPFCGHSNCQGSRPPFRLSGHLASTTRKHRLGHRTYAARQQSKSHAPISRSSELLPPPQHRPGDPGQFIGESDDRDILVYSRQQALRPASQCRILLRKMRESRRAPSISSFRRNLFPRLLMPRSFGLPPVVDCLGTSPSDAARSRALAKLSPRPIAAVRADAINGPIPGIDNKSAATSSAFA